MKNLKGNNKMKKLNLALKQIRLFHGMNQNQAAKKIRIAPYRISNIENEKRKVTIKIVEEYSNVFNLEVYTIFLIAELIGAEPEKIKKYESCLPDKAIWIIQWTNLQMGDK